MNKREWTILSSLVDEAYISQRDIAQKTGYSIGLVSSSLGRLVVQGYLDEGFGITEKTLKHIKRSKPQRAIILAAGMGLRMVPINKVPKGLLKINDQPLIERIIAQLTEVGITQIIVVTGFMTEKLEYLIDEFGVSIVYDSEYARLDSLHSLSLVQDYISNCYIVPSNVWFSRNPFRRNEYYSWYAVSEYISDDSYVRLNRKFELVYTDDELGGNSMVGLCYLRESSASKLRAQLDNMLGQRKFQKEPWEKALFEGNKMIPYARVLQGQITYVINTYEQLRELDGESKDLRSRRINLISRVFGVASHEITDISRLFKGMTNRLMRFSVDGVAYLLRVPGEGSNQLVSRKQETDVYKALAGTGLTDKVLYISPEDGFKISEFYEGSKVCDPNSPGDVKACMSHLRKLHELKIEVAHTFDIVDKMELYEQLRGRASSFADYNKVRENIIQLFELLGEVAGEKTLCHADPVHDNYLLTADAVYLIDWEYAGMCEPHVDIAMFCLYADHDKQAVDAVIETYYNGNATAIDRFKVYAYAAGAGLLWTVWCEYKEQMGVSYSEYAMRQYRYAKRFCKYATQLAKEVGIGKSLVVSGRRETE